MDIVPAVDGRTRALTLNIRAWAGNYDPIMSKAVSSSLQSSTRVDNETVIVLLLSSPLVIGFMEREWKGQTCRGDKGCVWNGNQDLLGVS